MSDLVRLEKLDKGVHRLWLNNPKAYNALSTQMMQAVLAALQDLEESALCRVLIIAGAGRGFCAGHDLKEVQALQTHEQRLALFQLCSEMMQKVQSVPFPVIAEVKGVATAAGCQLVATCDLAIASQDARFSTPGVNIGLFCSTPMVALSRNVGAKHAMEMLLSGDFVDAEGALQMGLVNKLVPEADLPDATYALAQKIAEKASRVLKIGKQAFYQQLHLPVAEAYALTAETMAQNAGEADAQEGMRAFVEKRAPKWRS